MSNPYQILQDLLVQSRALLNDYSEYSGWSRWRGFFIGMKKDHMAEVAQLVAAIDRREIDTISQLMWRLTAIPNPGDTLTDLIEEVRETIFSHFMALSKDDFEWGILFQAVNGFSIVVPDLIRIIDTLRPQQKASVLMQRNSSGQTAFMVAIQKYSKAATHHLWGAIDRLDLEDRLAFWNITDSHGWNALMVIANNNPKLIPSFLVGIRVFKPTERAVILLQEGKSDAHETALKLMQKRTDLQGAVGRALQFLQDEINALPKPQGCSDSTSHSQAAVLDQPEHGRDSQQESHHEACSTTLTQSSSAASSFELCSSDTISPVSIFLRRSPRIIMKTFKTQIEQTTGLKGWKIEVDSISISFDSSDQSRKQEIINALSRVSGLSFTVDSASDNETKIICHNAEAYLALNREREAEECSDASRNTRRMTRVTE